MAQSDYERRVTLLVTLIPFVAAEPCFALKGGTAINLFVRDMPRLSVDIDLTYLPVADRPRSLQDIDAAMRRIGDAIRRDNRRCRVSHTTIPGEKRSDSYVTKLFVQEDGVQVKIEVTPVLRGCVYPPATKSVSPTVEARFGYAVIQVVSFADLFAGKIVAALDRQHPRDLFDVRELLANEGVDDNLRKAFIVYILSHNRPMAEVLAPTRIDITAEYTRGFDDMASTPVAVEDLIQAREDIIASVVGQMPADHRKFLMSAKRGEPDWPLLGLPGVEELPAVRWRLDNLARMAVRRATLIEQLGTVLGVVD